MHVSVAAERNENGRRLLADGELDDDAAGFRAAVEGGTRVVGPLVQPGLCTSRPGGGPSVLGSVDAEE